MEAISTFSSFVCLQKFCFLNVPFNVCTASGKEMSKQNMAQSSLLKAWMICIKLPFIFKSNILAKLDRRCSFCHNIVLKEKYNWILSFLTFHIHVTNAIFAKMFLKQMSSFVINTCFESFEKTQT